VEAVGEVEEEGDRDEGDEDELDVHGGGSLGPS
jgi:hypothetical protein